jgi:hypothetical protein
MPCLLSFYCAKSLICITQCLSDFLLSVFGVNNTLYPIYILLWTDLPQMNLSGYPLAMITYAANLPHLEQTEGIPPRLVLLQAPQAIAITPQMGVVAGHDPLWPQLLHSFPQSANRTNTEPYP